MRFHRPRNAKVWHVVRSDGDGTLCGRRLDPEGTSFQPGDEPTGPQFALSKLCRACWVEHSDLGRRREAGR